MIIKGNKMGLPLLCASFHFHERWSPGYSFAKRGWKESGTEKKMICNITSMLNLKWRTVFILPRVVPCKQTPLTANYIRRCTCQNSGLVMLYGQWVAPGWWSMLVNWRWVIFIAILHPGWWRRCCHVVFHWSRRNYFNTSRWNHTNREDWVI